MVRLCKDKNEWDERVKADKTLLNGLMLGRYDFDEIIKRNITFEMVLSQHQILFDALPFVTLGESDSFECILEHLKDVKKLSNAGGEDYISDIYNDGGSLSIEFKDLLEKLWIVKLDSSPIGW